MESRGKWIAVALAAVLLFTSVGCLRTVHQKALKYADLVEAGYRAIRAEYTEIWRPRYQAVREVIRGHCEAGGLESTTCDGLAKGNDVFVRLDQGAQRIDSKAKDIGAAKDQALKILNEMEEALLEAGLDTAPAG